MNHNAILGIHTDTNQEYLILGKGIGFGKKVSEKEYEAAKRIRPLLLKRLKVRIDEHEVGYTALHIHSAINDEKVSQAMQIARIVRSCVELVERQTKKKIDVQSLAYNRLMNHIRYMAARVMSGEMGRALQCGIDEVEIGYLAMHIERVTMDELGEES